MPGSLFERGQLSAAEIASMRQKSVEFVSPSIYRAVWSEELVRHVCLESGVFGGFNAYYNVAVFLPDGTLGEQSIIYAPDGYEPYRLLQFAPMVIWFRDSTGNRKDFFQQAIAADEWQKRTKAEEDMLIEELAELEASGSNSEVVVALKARVKQIEDDRKKLGDK